MVLNTTNGMFDVSSVARSAGFALSSPRGSWGSAALHPRAGSPAEHLGWGARLYAVAALRGLRQIQPMNLVFQVLNSQTVDKNLYLSRS